MTIIELTEDHIEHLTEGARTFGRCSMLVESENGEAVIVAVQDNHRRGRPAKPRNPAKNPSTLSNLSLRERKEQAQKAVAGQEAGNVK